MTQRPPLQFFFIFLISGGRDVAEKSNKDVPVTYQDTEGECGDGLHPPLKYVSLQAWKADISKAQGEALCDMKKSSARFYTQVPFTTVMRLFYLILCWMILF